MVATPARCRGGPCGPSRLPTGGSRNKLIGERSKITPQHNIKAVIRPGEKNFVAECLEIAVITQGSTLDETVANLQEAVALHLEGEDLADFGLAPDPRILLTFEVELVNAQA